MKIVFQIQAGKNVFYFCKLLALLWARSNPLVFLPLKRFRDPDLNYKIFSNWIIKTDIFNWIMVYSISKRLNLQPSNSFHAILGYEHKLPHNTAVARYPVAER